MNLQVFLRVLALKIGEGDGIPLQYSCLENPRDGGAWWASVYGVAQSRTRLKRLSSSSSSLENGPFCCSFWDILMHTTDGRGTQERNES